MQAGWTTWVRRLGLGVAVAAAMVWLNGTPVRADVKKAENTATTPVPRKEKWWVEHHQRFLKEAKKGDIEVLFLGDSITEGWAGSGKEVWKKYYGSRKAANFGIGGDRTEHVLWRIENGELKGIHPRAVVLMIGTNNMSANTADQIADGVKAIVHQLRKRLPESKILLLGVFPRSPDAKDRVRAKVKKVNDEIAQLDDGGKHVRYLDIGNKFLDAEGNLPRDIMPDSLHPNARGYEIWAKAIEPTLDKMLGE